MMETIAVWFSCGAASAVAAKKTIELYGKTHKIRVINNPIVDEDVDNKRFLLDVEKWLGLEIEFAINPKYPNCSITELFEKRGYMSGVGGAICTYELKKKARYHWEKTNKAEHYVLGFTFDEKMRHDDFVLSERELLPVLIDLEITKADCFKILQEAGIKLPRIYELGYPNANCIGCVKASSVTYWNHVRVVHPEIFEQRAEQSERLGVKLTRCKGKRITLRELSPDAKGRPMKNMDFECGIFCTPEAFAPTAKG